MKNTLRFISLWVVASFATASHATTLNPVQLLNPAGSVSGQAVVSTGASSAPAWGAVNAAQLGGATFAAPGPIGSTTPSTGAFTTLSANSTITGFVGRLLNVQVFSASGTYTPTTGTAKIIVRVQAPGGGSGGAAATSTGQSATGSGGGAGSYAEVLVTSGFSGATITIGSVGTGATAGANNGTAGGTTSFGSIVSCAGGTGGFGGSALSATGPTGAAGAASACTISGATTLYAVQGNGSGPGTVFTPGTFSLGGTGGSSPIGVGGQNKAGSGSGLSGVGYGAGAGGANNLASASAAAGANGQPAIVIVYEFSN